MLTFTLTFTLWAVAHSLTAGTTAKAWFRRVFGDRAYEGLYRPLYNIISTVTFLLFLAATAALIPEHALWSVPMPARLINYAVIALGMAGLAYSLWQTDIWQFAGLRQLANYLRGAPHPESADTFIDSGAYAIVRHPLYLFSLLILWAIPDMSLRSAVLNLLVTAYFVVGSIFEERKLVAVFGEPYQRYQRRVPRLVPLPRPSRSIQSNDPA
jgi:protein-S-isoprenylcysteine O-methyltransferase Ste14